MEHVSLSFSVSVPAPHPLFHSWLKHHHTTDWLHCQYCSPHLRDVSASAMWCVQDPTDSGPANQSGAPQEQSHRQTRLLLIDSLCCHCPWSYPIYTEPCCVSTAIIIFDFMQHKTYHRFNYLILHIMGCIFCILWYATYCVSEFCIL